MKFYETITETEIQEYDKNIDSKRKQGKFESRNLKTKLKASKYNELRQIVAFFKKEYNVNVYKSDLLYIGLCELLENNPNAEDFINVLAKYDKI